MIDFLLFLFLNFRLNTLLHGFQATAAFDGIRTSKWEEPNGGRGTLIFRCIQLEHKQQTGSRNENRLRSPFSDPCYNFGNMIMQVVGSYTNCQMAKSGDSWRTS